jgi:hypothetical protein
MSNHKLEYNPDKNEIIFLDDDHNNYYETYEDGLFGVISTFSGDHGGEKSRYRAIKQWGQHHERIKE